MTATPSDIIADALRAANTPRVRNTAHAIATLYCGLLNDGYRADRYIALSHIDGGLPNTDPVYATDSKTAVHCPVYDGELPCDEADDDDMVDSSFDMLADLLAEQGGMLCLRDGTDLRYATPEEIAESWIVGGAGMIEAIVDGLKVDAYVETYMN